MKILLINKFLYPKGGDAVITLNTGELLVKMGHQVIFWGMKHSENPEYLYQQYFVENTDYLNSKGIKKKIVMAFKIFYSLEAKRKIEELIKIQKIDVVHLNNFAHQISPSILSVFHKYKIPTVMTLHDYKLVCPSYSLLNNRKPCERCKHGKYYWCFLKKCTKNSYGKSLINTIEMYLHHKIMHIYDLIDIFIPSSKFLKEKAKEMGFDKEMIYLANFVDMDDFQPLYDFNNRTICYFGRLSEEKGLFTLLDAVKKVNARLKIIGIGPIQESLKLKIRSSNLDNVQFVGYKTGKELKEEIRNSAAVVLPSEWYENNPKAVLEAFALGKPVIGARIGGIPELVKDGETGLTFESGNYNDLRNKIEYLLGNPGLAAEMGRNARKFVEENFSAQKHYDKLMEIYQRAISKQKGTQ